MAALSPHMSLSDSKYLTSPPLSSASTVTSPQLGADKSTFSELFHKTEFCKFWLQGKCLRGSACRFAHNVGELKHKPNLQKTRLCEAFQKGTCEDEQCPFAHGVDDLRHTEEFFKTSLCIFWKKGVECPQGPACRYAHGDLELRPKKVKVKTPRHKKDGKGSNVASPALSAATPSPSNALSPQAGHAARFHVPPMSPPPATHTSPTHTHIPAPPPSAPSSAQQPLAVASAVTQQQINVAALIEAITQQHQAQVALAHALTLAAAASPGLAPALAPVLQAASPPLSSALPSSPSHHAFRPAPPSVPAPTGPTLQQQRKMMNASAPAFVPLMQQPATPGAPLPPPGAPPALAQSLTQALTQLKKQQRGGNKKQTNTRQGKKTHTPATAIPPPTATAEEQQDLTTRSWRRAVLEQAAAKEETVPAINILPPPPGFSPKSEARRLSNPETAKNAILAALGVSGDTETETASLEKGAVRFADELGGEQMRKTHDGVCGLTPLPAAADCSSSDEESDK